MGEIMQSHMVMHSANSSFGKRTKLPLQMQLYISNFLSSRLRRKFCYVTQPLDLCYAEMSREPIFVHPV